MNIDKIPLPSPDRRNEKKESTSSLYQYNQLNQNNTLEISDLVKLKHIEDMRKNIFNYQALSDKSMFLPSNMKNVSIPHCNIILFGPSGSGKSSFIKSLYRALYNNSYLPPEAMNKLIIKGHFENEGTLCFTRLHLKEQSKSSTGLILCDTRGHMSMKDDEKEQFKVLLTGNIKDDVKLEQRKERNPFALWEFWKKDSELFPNEIFNATEAGLESIPHGLVFVFDGSNDDLFQEEEIPFYKELVKISLKKGYENIHVILTRIDVFEKNENERAKSLSQIVRSTRVNTIKDEKIENVIKTLGVSRSNIHFIENYHKGNDNENNSGIDYHLLKTLLDILNAAELFILKYLNRSEMCLAGCFGRKG